MASVTSFTLAALISVLTYFLFGFPGFFQYHRQLTLIISLRTDVLMHSLSSGLLQIISLYLTEDLHHLGITREQQH